MARPPKVDLSPYQNDIAAWLDQGKSLQDIADLLERTHSIGVSRQQVRHYIDSRLPDHKAGTSAGQPEPVEPPSEPILGRLPDSPENQESSPPGEISHPVRQDTPLAQESPAAPKPEAECPKSLFPDPPPKTNDMPERLKKVLALQQLGAITESESQEAIERILGLPAGLFGTLVKPEVPQPQSAPVELPAKPASDEAKVVPAPPSPAVVISTPKPEPIVSLPAVAEPLPVDPLPVWQPPQLPFPPLDNPPVWTPDLPILSFGEGDDWTLRDACEGTFILGATGSGKTSGSGKTLAQSFLASGFGGLVLCVKEDERSNWERYAHATGRSKHLCIVSPGNGFRFNFLDYESQRPGVGMDWIENVVQIFHILQEVRHRNSEYRGDPFWIEGPDSLLRNTLRVIAHAKRGLSLNEITQFISEAPMSLEAAKSEAWRSSSCFGPYMEEAQRLIQLHGSRPEMRQAERYWLQEFPSMHGKMRATLITIFSTLIDGFFNSDIHTLFCTDTNLTPESVLRGAIILVDLPLKTRDFTGLLAQSIWKYFFQKAVERRRDPADACRRPVFLWADEAQFLYSEYDALFQSTARSSACATVYLTQNIANFYGIYGGNRDKINGFLGNLNTKIFHANNDQASNHWAAEQIGKATQYKASVSSQEQQPPRGWRDVLSSIYRPPSSNGTTSSHVDYAVQPSEFTRLRMGAEHNDFQVDAYFVKNGARFSNGKQHFKTTFLQEP